MLIAKSESKYENYLKNKSPNFGKEFNPTSDSYIGLDSIEDYNIKFDFVCMKVKGNRASKKRIQLTWNEFMNAMIKSTGRELDLSWALNDPEKPNKAVIEKKSLTICQCYSSLWEMRAEYKQMIVIDFDNAIESDYNNLITYLDKHDIKHFIHNTYSHIPLQKMHNQELSADLINATDGAPYKFRLYIPMNTMIPASSYGNMLEGFLWDALYRDAKTRPMKKGYYSSKSEVRPIADGYSLYPYSFMSTPPVGGSSRIRIWRQKGNKLINPTFYNEAYNHFIKTVGNHMENSNHVYAFTQYNYL